jgi:hypothetical protein
VTRALGVIELSGIASFTDNDLHILRMY